MPNWCGNYTEIEGPTDLVQDLFEAGKDERFLEHMAPIGEWDYNDALSSWGTKWDIDIGRMDFKKLDNDRAILKGYFESAWSPPEQAFLTFLYNNKDVNVKLLLSVCCISPTIWDPAESTVVTAGNLDKLCVIVFATPA